MKEGYKYSGYDKKLVETYDWEMSPQVNKKSQNKTQGIRITKPKRESIFAK